MGTGFLLDTNIAIYFRAGKLPEDAKNFVQNVLEFSDCGLSVISKMEILGWNFVDEDEEKQTIDFINDLSLHRLTDDIVDKTIELRKKMPKTRLPDAIIASTALVNKLTLISRDVAGFSKIKGLQLVNPFEL
jgi:predicted nucleic acid-binding protein